MLNSAMSNVAKLLPTEVAALVHHVELTRAGWWDKAVHRLVLAAVWLADKPLTVREIQIGRRLLWLDAQALPIRRHGRHWGDHASGRRKRANGLARCSQRAAVTGNQVQHA